MMTTLRVVANPIIHILLRMSQCTETERHDMVGNVGEVSVMERSMR